MTKQERNRIKREMHEKTIEAWNLGYEVSKKISLPYEIEALDAMIAELQGMRQFKVEQLERMKK